MSRYLKEELLLLLGIAGAAGIAGILSGWLFPCLLLGLLGYLAHHLYHLARLPEKIKQGAISRASLPRGLWHLAYSAVADQQNAEQQRSQGLSIALSRIHSAFNALSDAVVVLDERGMIEWTNPAAEALLGIPYPASPGHAFSDLVRDPVLVEYMDGAEFGKPLAFTAPADKTKLLSLCVTTPGDGSAEQIIVARDMTREYHIENTRRDFVANVSHELRTPLTVISGLLEHAVTNDEDPVTSKRSQELMRQQAVRMQELVTDLLTLSRMESEVNPTKTEPVPVPALVAEIANDALALSGTAGHQVQLDIQSQDWLRGDASEVRTAFSNLVTNAIRHTPARTIVQIQWSSDATGARFSVSDTGEGIAARHLPRLTERLYRVDESRSRDTGGTGLGLAIVKHALERHDARLEITSTVGRGSTFSCLFPPARVIKPGTSPE